MHDNLHEFNTSTFAQIFQKCSIRTHTLCGKQKKLPNVSVNLATAHLVHSVEMPYMSSLGW
jgi:hypothetical protein